MASRTPRWRWPWYYHVLWLAYCIAISVLYTLIRPTGRQADIGFCITLALLAAILTAIQVHNRKKMSKRDGGGPPQDDGEAGGRG